MNEWNPETKSLKWERTDYLIRKIEELNLKFIPLLLKEEQCSHYFPIWKFDEFPELKEKHLSDTNGRNNCENVDFYDPRIFPILKEYFREVIQRYGKSEALAFYNIWNEPHYDHVEPHVLSKFTSWLQLKYTSLAALNRSWGEEYSDWNQVSPLLNDDWNSSMPNIDWRLFRNEQNGEILKELTAEVRKWDSVHPVNANPVGSFVTGGKLGSYTTDNWQFTPYNDFNGGSYYPDSWNRTNSPLQQPFWHHNAAFSALRSAAYPKNYILTEIYTNAKGGLALGGYLDYNQTKTLAWIALANDAKGLIYWKWEPFKRGRQSLGRGLTRMDGSLASRGEAVKDLGEILKKHGKLLAQSKLEKPQVGILLDMVGLLKSHDQSIDIRTQDFMQKSVAGLFKTLDKKNITSEYHSFGFANK